MEPQLEDGLPQVVSHRTLRQFAALWVVFFAGLGYWQGFWRDDPVLGLIFVGLAVIIGPMGLIRPEAIRPIFLGSMAVAFPIGWSISQVLVACLFYGVITPTALLFKVVGRDALHRRARAHEGTYWTRKSHANHVRRYFRQF